MALSEALGKRGGQATPLALAAPGGEPGSRAPQLPDISALPFAARNTAAQDFAAKFRSAAMVNSSIATDITIHAQHFVSESYAVTVLP